MGLVGCGSAPSSSVSVYEHRQSDLGFLENRANFSDVYQLYECKRCTSIGSWLQCWGEDDYKNGGAFKLAIGEQGLALWLTD